jgi:hypothetical protein
MMADFDDEFDSEEDDLIVQAAVTGVIGATFALIHYAQTYCNKPPYHDSLLMSSARSLATLASGWAPESAYGEPTSPNHAHAHRSSLATVSQSRRDALCTFYERFYGHDSKRCLVTQQKESLVIAHIVPCTSSPDRVR